MSSVSVLIGEDETDADINISKSLAAGGLSVSVLCLFEPLPDLCYNIIPKHNFWGLFGVPRDS